MPTPRHLFLGSAAALIPLFALLPDAHAQVLPDAQTSSKWFADGRALVDQRLQEQSRTPVRARNVILFVGDGMGVSTLTAARIHKGQLAGLPGEEGALSFERFPYSALVKTYNVDAQVPDSAGTMTAMVSGLKTDVGTIGADEDVVRGTCASLEGNTVPSALELAEIRGLATGVVSTARITHATPAATYAKSADRNWEDISDMPESERACEDIASQLVNFEANLEARYVGTDVDGLEVVMGGGRRHFLPKDAAFNSADARSDVEGDRTDGRDLRRSGRRSIRTEPFSPTRQASPRWIRMRPSTCSRSSTRATCSTSRTVPTISRESRASRK